MRPWSRSARARAIALSAAQRASTRYIVLASNARSLVRARMPNTAIVAIAVTAMYGSGAMAPRREDIHRPFTSFPDAHLFVYDDGAPFGEMASELDLEAPITRASEGGIETDRRD